MAKIKVKANKLEDATVTFISLVNRGANRIPFRIIKLDKQENDMSLDLGTLFRRSVKKEDVTPKLVGIVVAKHAKSEDVETVLKTAGLSIESKEVFEDGTVVYKQADSVEGASVFRLNDRTLALVTGFDGSKVTGEMARIAKEEGFYPEIELVASALVHKADDEMKADLDYVRLVKQTISEPVLKAATELFALPAEVVEKECGPKGKHMDEEMTDEEKAAAEAEKAKAKKAEEDAAAAEAAKTAAAEPKVVEPAAPSLTIEQVQEVVQKAVAEALKSMTEVVSKSIDGVTAQVSDIKEQTEGLVTKMAEVEKVAKAADESVRGKVIGGDPVGDRVKQTPVKKQDDDPRTGLFDTAFLPRRTSVSKFQRK